MHAVFRGKRWRVEFTKVRGVHGDCDPPDKPGRSIRLCPSSCFARKLETAIHEGLHASLWDLDEQAVTETAHDLTRFLTRLIEQGYLRDKP